MTYNNELRQIVESNARTIQAMLETQATERLRDEERRLLHQERIERLENISAQLANTTNGIANLLAYLDEDRPTILRRLMTIENKIDRLLENQ
jgi:hypothetical protein